MVYKSWYIQFIIFWLLICKAPLLSTAIMPFSYTFSTRGENKGVMLAQSSILRHCMKTGPGMFSGGNDTANMIQLC